MRGHEPIIAMRKTRRAPAIVFLNDGWYDGMARHWHENGDHATVETKGDESIESLDLRFLVGLTVSISSDSEDRAKRLMEACKAVGAKRIGACAYRRVNEYRVESTWNEVWHG